MGSLTPPYSTSAQIYSLGVMMKIGTDSVNKTILLSVSAWSVSNWAACSTSSGSTWATCSAGYQLSSTGSSWTQTQTQTTSTAKTYTEEKALGTSVSVTTISTTSATIVGSTVTASSSSGAWMMINQYQLLLLVPVLETELPEDLLKFMDQFEFATFKFDFLKGWKFGNGENTIDSFSFDQTVPGLKTVGYDSGSIIVNEYNFAKGIFNFVSFHIFTIISFYWLYKWREKKCIKKIFEKLFDFLSLTVYVRILIEAFLFIFIISLSEIVVTSANIQSRLSYAWAWISFLWMLLFPAFLLFHYIKYHKTEKFGEEGKFTEVYDGFKNNHLSKLYHFAFCIRRILSGIVLVSLRTSNLIARLVIFDTIQIIALLYTIFVRPFDSITENFMEILNEFVFLFFCIIVSVLNKSSMWSTGLTNIVLSIIMINGLLIGLVLIVVFVFEITKLLKSKFIVKRFLEFYIKYFKSKKVKSLEENSEKEVKSVQNVEELQEQEAEKVSIQEERKEDLQKEFSTGIYLNTQAKVIN